MINEHTALGPEDLWEKIGDERNPSKSIVAAKIMRNARNNVGQNFNDCKCIYCSLIGENKELVQEGHRYNKQKLIERGELKE